MPNMSNLSKLIGAGVKRLVPAAEEATENALTQVPGQDMSAAFRPPKISDMGTDSMSGDELRNLHDYFLQKGAQPTDDRMRMLRGLADRKSAIAERNAGQVQAATSAAPTQANMITGGMTFQGMDPTDMGIQMGAGIAGIGYDPNSERSQQIKADVRAKMKSLQQWLSGGSQPQQQPQPQQQDQE